MTEYNVKYLGVLCTGAEWNYKEPNKFLFTYCGRNFEFTQQQEISCSADTDHIRCVIEEQFLPWWRSDYALKNLQFKIVNEVNYFTEIGDTSDYMRGRIDALKECLKDILNIFYPMKTDEEKEV